MSRSAECNGQRGSASPPCRCGELGAQARTPVSGIALATAGAFALRSRPRRHCKPSGCSSRPERSQCRASALGLSRGPRPRLSCARRCLLPVPARPASGGPRQPARTACMPTFGEARSPRRRQWGASLLLAPRFDEVQLLGWLRKRPCVPTGAPERRRGTSMGQASFWHMTRTQPRWTGLLRTARKAARHRHPRPPQQRSSSTLHTRERPTQRGQRRGAGPCREHETSRPLWQRLRMVKPTSRVSRWETMLQCL
mmetsp:Transcript_16054/g.60718  ORF Transcript_16054/g.60718 Transcript_16054/m.60718 type:complete len:254 (+) Transcript_16054:828-1589(+)